MFMYAVFGNLCCEEYLANTQMVHAADHKNEKIIAVSQNGAMITVGIKVTSTTIHTTNGIKNLGCLNFSRSIFINSI